MSKEPQPLFVEKQGYRRRRLSDAARLLPVFGAILWLIPLLWPRGTEGAAATTKVMLYVFGLWFCLVVLSGLISQALGRGGKSDSEDPEVDEPL